MSESITGLGIVWIIFLILTFFVPFFIFKIRNEVVKMNNKMDTIIEILGSSTTNKEIKESNEHNYTLEMSSYGTDKKNKVCKKCGRRNTGDEHTCIECGTMFI
jgi:hypothetical protein